MGNASGNSSVTQEDNPGRASQGTHGGVPDEGPGTKPCVVERPGQGP